MGGGGVGSLGGGGVGSLGGGGVGSLGGGGVGSLGGGDTSLEGGGATGLETPLTRVLLARAMGLGVRPPVTLLDLSPEERKTRKCLFICCFILFSKHLKSCD